MTPSAAMQAATRAAVEHDTQGKGGIISKHAPARLVALPTDWRTFSPGTLWVVVLLALVATALGMPKRKRWAQLGGHGRHGAG